MPNKTLAIDPSGTGTTGTFFKNQDQEHFSSFTDKDWKQHYLFIVSLVKQHQPNLLLLENSNFVNLRGKDMTSLFKLLGAIEVLEVEKIKNIPVDQVKRLRSKILAQEKQIKDLEYLPGRGKGWMYKGKRVSLHELDAYLLFQLFFLSDI